MSKNSQGILKRIFKWLLLIVLILAGAYLGLRNETVKSRIQSFTGQNQAAQKVEYQKQRRLAEKKYGSSKTSRKKEASTKSSSSKKATQTKSKNSSSTERTKETTTKKVTAEGQSSSKSSSSISSSTSQSSSVTAYRSYVVESGDTLSRIASEYQTTTAAIMKANDLADNSIQSGETLKIPKSSSNLTSSQSE